MNRLLPAALALCLGALPALADEFTDTLESALKAYRDGDIKAAGEDLGYATKLLGSQRAVALGALLPPAPSGWTRTDDNTEDAAIGMAIFGGGTTVGATYSDGTDDIKLTLMADSPMISGMGAMITGMAAMGGGKPLRITRVEFGQNHGELHGSAIMTPDGVVLTLNMELARRLSVPAGDIIGHTIYDFLPPEGIVWARVENSQAIGSKGQPAPESYFLPFVVGEL